MSGSVDDPRPVPARAPEAWHRRWAHRLATDRTLLILIGLFVLAVALRFVFVRYARLAGDEAYYYGRAWLVAEGKGLPALGPDVTSGEARLPGGSFVTLMAFPLLFWNSPLACMAWVALLSVLGYALWTAVVRRWFGDRAAVAYAALLLFSPWSFFYSDRIWNPNVVILASGALLFAFTRMIDRPGSRHVFWIPLAVMAVPQFHLSGLLLIPLAVALWLVWRPRVHFGAALLGIVSGVVLYFPYLWFEIRHGFRNTRALLSMPPDPGHGVFQVARTLWQFFGFGTTELGYHVEKGYWSHPYLELRYYFERHGFQTTADFFGGGLGGALLVGVTVGTLILAAFAWLRWLWRIARAGRGAFARLTRTPLDLTFGLALVLLPLLTLGGKKVVHPHYLYVFYPVAYLPLLYVFGSRLRGRSLVPVALWLALVVPVGLWASARYYRVEDHPISVGEQERLLEYIYDSAEEEEYAIDIRLPRLAYFPYTLHQLAWAHLHRPLRENAESPQRYVVLPRDEGFRRLREPPPHRIDGRPVRDYRVIDTAVIFRTGFRPAPAVPPAATRPVDRPRVVLPPAARSPRIAPRPSPAPQSR